MSVLKLRSPKLRFKSLPLSRSNSVDALTTLKPLRVYVELIKLNRENGLLAPSLRQMHNRLMPLGTVRVNVFITYLFIITYYFKLIIYA